MRSPGLRPIRTMLACAAPALVLGACGGGAAFAPDAQVAAAGMARVQLVATRALSDGSTRLDAAARFVRFAGVAPEGAAALAGVATPESVAPGACALFEPASRVQSALAAREDVRDVDLELLDAGPLSFRIGGAFGADLAPQRAPDLVPYLSGVEYGTTVVAPGEALDGQEVTFAASGGADLRSFGLVATMPPEPRIAVVAGIDVTGTYPVLASARTPIEVRWQPVGAAAPGDSLYVELRSDPLSETAFVCNVNDTGVFQLPAGAASQLPGARDSYVYTLTMLRLRSLALTVPGLGATGELALGSREDVAVTITP